MTTLIEMPSRAPRPYALGFNAGMFGEDARACPYDKDTHDYQEWQHGHRRGADYARHVALGLKKLRHPGGHG